ncbi:hypothetical protein A2524_02055 [Candidatus Wolfebacteria bacterium RIFOXYD12_FULL_48_21]|nr:MAG: hypothetical protein A2524_02055 [Candidatus Wolfebacteria bacterium RIFOXYD12_FULL_48_21]OGM95681.1 MAG: hypothetical protein A2532_02865 [Candidatus Wolfebacteria bacterium RIFOXYD2_FULL_48_11]
MNIKRSYEKVKNGAPEFGWDEKDLNEAIKIAEGLKRSDLIIFWLQQEAKESEASFDNWFKDLQLFSKQEIIDIIHELGPKVGQEFIDKFKK